MRFVRVPMWVALGQSNHGSSDVSKRKITILPGDGIGPEVIAQARRVLEWFVARRKLDVVLDEHPYGAGAYRAHGQVLPRTTEDAINSAHAILLGAVGGMDAGAIRRHRHRQYFRRHPVRLRGDGGRLVRHRSARSMPTAGRCRAAGARGERSAGKRRAHRRHLRAGQVPGLFERDGRRGAAGAGSPYSTLMPPSRTTLLHWAMSDLR